MLIYLQTPSQQSSWMPPGQMLGAKSGVCSHSRWGIAYGAIGKGKRQSFPGISGTAAARVYIQKHTPHIGTDTHTERPASMDTQICACSLQMQACKSTGKPAVSGWIDHYNHLTHHSYTHQKHIQSMSVPSCSHWLTLQRAAEVQPSPEFSRVTSKWNLPWLC